MNDQAWLRRLREQLPGWKVWRAGIGGTDGEGWCAVPAPSGTDIGEALKLPYRLGPYAKPQQLRERARERYGHGHTCQTCGVDWRRCGHRKPETRDW